MPTYGYECKACGNAFEVFQKITDDSLTTCEQCGGELKKKIFPVGIVFKGSGFYVNDYANKGASKEGATSAAPEASSAAPAPQPAGSDSAAAASDTKPSTSESVPSAPSTPVPAPAAAAS